MTEKNKIIIVVDDEEDIRNSVAEVLHHEGYKVVLAVDGDDFLKKVKTVTPDLIIFDVMMPGTPVKTIIKHIDKNTKVIYCSVVKVSDSEKNSLLKPDNVVDFINKPFDLDELIRRVKKII